MDDVVISTKDRPGTYDGLETAKPGEIVFTLQGGDPFAPGAVQCWADLARAAGIAEQNEEAARKLLKKASAAEMVAWAMRAQQRGEPQEAPEGKRARYVEPTTPEAADIATVLAHGAARLQNALAESLVIAESLAKLHRHPDAEVNIREAVALLKDAALEIEPRRHLRGEG